MARFTFDPCCLQTLATVLRAEPPPGMAVRGHLARLRRRGGMLMYVARALAVRGRRASTITDWYGVSVRFSSFFKRKCCGARCSPASRCYCDGLDGSSRSARRSEAAQRLVQRGSVDHLLRVHVCATDVETGQTECQKVRVGVVTRVIQHT